MTTAVLSFCGLVCSFMQTLVIPLAPELPFLLDTSPSNASWVVTATLLAAAVSAPISGRLGDMYGKRCVILALLLLIVLGSVVAGLSTSLSLVVTGRVLQGAGMGVIPLGISILNDVIPVDRVGSSVALMSSTLGVGSALGVPLAAFVSTNADWHLLFWVSAVLAVCSACAVYLFVPEGDRLTPARLDFIGAFGLSVGLTAVLLSLSKGSDWGWSSPATIGAAAGGGLSLMFWGLYEWRTPYPLVDLRTSSRRVVASTNFVSVLVGFGLFASAAVLPQLLQIPSSTGVGLGQSMLVASLCIAPTGLVMMVTAPIAARLSSRRSPRASLLVGASSLFLGYSIALFMMNEVWQVVLVGCVIGVGVGFSFAALPSLIMGAVPENETGAANGLNTVMRSIGTSTASALTAVILASSAAASDGTFPTAAGFRTSFVCAGAASLLAIAVTLSIPRGRKHVGEDEIGPETSSVTDTGENVSTVH